MLDDADIAQHFAVLTERFEAARAVLAAIPEQPTTSSFLAVESGPAPDALFATVTGLLGALSLEGVMTERGSNLSVFS